MLNYVKTMIGLTAGPEPILNPGGPNYKPPFTIANPACYGVSVPVEGYEPQNMVVAMINTKKDMDAWNFAKNDLPKYKDIIPEYVYEGIDHHLIRLQTATFSNCYEKAIFTNEIPKEPTFQYWELSNIRRITIAKDMPQHEWNLAMLRNGFELKDGETVKLEWSQDDFDQIAQKQYTIQVKTAAKKQKADEQEAYIKEYRRKIAAGETVVETPEQEKIRKQHERQESKQDRRREKSQGKEEKQFEDEDSVFRYLQATQPDMSFEEASALAERASAPQDKQAKKFKNKRK